ncbi:hypothetical protein [Aureivirga marina]|uniref:hypothetical protein n=1 Tax=Aureivirga marina TaxID=1182451 RepID=UPI0018CB9131|nr:hypothetical protein [Aureivirga marina]
MKKILLTLVLMLNICFAFAQSHIGKAKVVNGLEVYVFMEPLRSYETVLTSDITSNINAKSLISSGLSNEKPDEKMSQYINNIKRQASKQGAEIDAVIYSEGKSAIGIKFTEDKTDENYRLGELQKVDNLAVYFFSEPIKEYEELKTIKAGSGSMASLGTAGIVNSSIKEDIIDFVRKAKRKTRKNKADFIIYSGGKRAVACKFKS